MTNNEYTVPRGMSRGCVPRDIRKAPLGSSIPMFDRLTIPKSEWSDRLREKRLAKAMLSDVRDIMGPAGGMIPALNQGRDPWCWAFSPVTAATLARANAGIPYEHLSGNAVGNKVADFRVRGGWSEESMAHMKTLGAPSTAFWPEGDNARHFDNPDTWSNARESIMVEWYDIDPRDTAAINTCLLLNIPMAVDVPAWAHSICLIDPVEGFTEYDHLNSWGNKWNGNGIGRLRGKFTKFDSVIACVVSTGA